jgi:hypothetical protein
VRPARRLAPCLLALASFSLLAAAPPPRPEVARLIAQLGSERFAEREGATRQLEAAGESALGALRKALTSDDLEVRRRAKRLVAALERKP